VKVYPVESMMARITKKIEPKRLTIEQKSYTVMRGYPKKRRRLAKNHENKHKQSK